MKQLLLSPYALGLLPFALFFAPGCAYEGDSYEWQADRCGSVYNDESCGICAQDACCSESMACAELRCVEGTSPEAEEALAILTACANQHCLEECR